MISVGPTFRCPGLIAAIGLFLFMAASIQQPPSSEPSEDASEIAITRLREALTFLVLPPREKILHREENPVPTWLPERGWRGLYADYGITPAFLETVTGETVFLTGPHGAAMDFKSTRDFGRYNPDFLLRLIALAETLSGNSTARALARDFYAARLTGMAAAYGKAKAIVDAPENAQTIREVIAEYEYRIEAGTLEPGGFGNFPYDAQLELLHAAGETDADFYELVTAVGFWIRRRMDGSEPLFHELMLKSFVIVSVD
ncbi:hypothetical protein [Nisaea denitrificans]|uniref:hypothetical protein n=1 Tax=Nisaea denitrificans TaxID=390877 RepID=UPI000403E04A|nr:hypothetical protein [Nisaea denitrificans]